MLSADPRIGEQLLEAGIVTREKLDQGIALQKFSGGCLTDVLLTNKLVEERKLLRFLAQTSGARYITSDKLATAAISPETLSRIPVRHAERMLVLPLSYGNGTLTLAIAEVEPSVVEQVRLAAGVSAIAPIIATRAAIRAGIKRFYLGDTYAFAPVEETHASAVVEPGPTGKVLAREASRVGPPPLPPPFPPVLTAPVPMPPLLNPPDAPSPPPRPEPVAAPARKDEVPAIPVLIPAPVAARSPVPAPLPVAAPSPVADPAPILVADPAPILVADPAPILVGDSAPILVADSAPIPVADPAPIPVADPAPILVADPAPIPVAAPIAGPTPTRAPVGKDGLEREVLQLRVASDLHRHLARVRDSGEILHRVLAFAFDHLPAEEGVLLRIEPRTHALSPHAVRNRSGSRSKVVVSDTFLKEVVESRQGMLIGDALIDERFNRAQSVISAGLRSALGAPLIVSGEVRGVIFLATRVLANAFRAPDLSVLMSIASEASFALESAEMARQAAAETANRASLGRSFPPVLIEQACSGAVTIASTGETHQAVVLSVGIRGFGLLRERLGPRELVSTLNEHFAQMADIVFAQGGMIDRVTDDALLALWNVPVARDDSAVRALRAALEMVERVGLMNELRQAESRIPFEIGVGISTGQVVFGAIGAPRRMEFSAVGDAILSAERLREWANPGQVLVSEAALRSTGDRFVGEPVSPRPPPPSAIPRVYTVQQERAPGPGAGRR